MKQIGDQYKMTESDKHPPSMKEEMERLGIREDTMNSMKLFFLKTSVPRFIEEKRKGEERERLALDNANNNQDEGKGEPMRRIRGAKELVKYLESINCPISESTIYKLLREKRIPSIRPSDLILLFDLDAIDRWLTVDDSKKHEKEVKHAKNKRC